MKLLLDDQVVSLEKKEPFPNMVREAVDTLFKEYGDRNNRIYIDWDPRFLTTAENEKGVKIPQYPTQKMFKPVFNYLSKYTNENSTGEKTIRMFLTYNRKKDITVYKPNSYPITGRMSFTKKDVELVFFLIFVSPFCEYLPEENLRKFQNTTREGDVWYGLRSAEKSAVKTIEDTQLESKILYRLTTDEKDHRMTTAQLELCARKLGVNVGSGMSENVIRQFLINQVRKTENKTELLVINEVISNDKSLELWSKVQIAKDKNIIGVYSKQGIGKYWAYVGENDQAGDMIMKLSSKEKQEEQLIDLLQSNKESLDRLNLEIQAANIG